MDHTDEKRGLDSFAHTKTANSGRERAHTTDFTEVSRINKVRVIYALLLNVESSSKGRS